MGRLVETYLVDDLTQERGDDVQTHSLELNGVSYEIDLSATSYEDLESKLAPFMKAGRRTSSTKGKRPRKASAHAQKRVPVATFSDADPDPAEIRRWAEERKIEVPARGRIPRSVREQFVAAQGAAA